MNTYKVKARDGEVVTVNAHALATSGPRVYLDDESGSTIAIFENPSFVIKLEPDNEG